MHSIHLKKLGFETELFYDGPLPADWKKRACLFVPLNSLVFGFPPSFEVFRKIEKLIKNLKTFDVVLIHHHICPFLAYYLTLSIKTKLVWYSGEPLRALWESHLTGITTKELRSTIKPTSNECYGKSFTSLFLSNTLHNASINFLRALDKRTARSYPKIIVNSGYTRDIIKKIYNVDNEIPVAYPGIEIEQTASNQEKNGSKNYILAIGAMIPMKNHITLLKAYRQLPPKYRSAVNLVIIGDGPLKKRIETAANKLGLTNVIIQPQVDEQELLSHYQNCKFIIHLALNEPFGLVPIEAAIFGKPSIVSNQGGTKEFIKHGENGFLVDPYDLNDVEKHMKCLIEDPQLTEELGARAKEVAMENFSIEKSAEKIVECLKTVTHREGD